MGNLARDLIGHLKEISWILFLVYILLGFIVLIFGKFIGYFTIAWISIGIAFLTTILFVSIVAGELLLKLIMDLFRHLIQASTRDKGKRSKGRI
jgi:hypothetical protein